MPLRIPMLLALALSPVFAHAQATAAAPAPAGIAVGPTTLDALAGRYRTPLGSVLRLWRQGDGLMLQVDDQPAVALVAESESLFRVDNPPATISFGFDARGKPGYLILRQGGRDIRATRI